MIKLSEFLIKKQSKNCFHAEEDNTFYYKHVGLIPNCPKLSVYKRAKTPFEIIRANIIIRGLINKQSIDNQINKCFSFFKNRHMSISVMLKNIKDSTNDMPCYLDKNERRIIIPLFTPHLNELYTNRVDLLTRDPYKKLRKSYINSIIDPFDFYGPELYDSQLSKLIKIDSKNGNTCYYDYDSETLFFIDEQGRLENSFALFDKELINPDKSNMITRAKPVAEAYYKDNKANILRSLIDNKLISSKTIQEFVDSEKEVKDYDKSK